MKLILKNARVDQAHVVVDLKNSKRNTPFATTEFEGRKVWVTDRKYWVDSKKRTVHSNAIPNSLEVFIHVFDDYYYEDTTMWQSHYEEQGLLERTQSKIRQLNNNPEFFKEQVLGFKTQLTY